jgi:hypothetical protein
VLIAETLIVLAAGILAGFFLYPGAQRDRGPYQRRCR